MARGRRDLALERQWRERMAGWLASGLRVREFCLRRGLTEPTFHYWRRELRMRDAAASTAAMSSSSGKKSRPAFIPLTVFPTATLAVEVRCPSGHVVLLPSCDATSLVSLFAALDPQARGTQSREAHEAVVRIKQLYAVEHEAKAFEVAERRSLRQQKSVPLLAALKPWLEQLAVTTLPKSPLGEAVTYARNQWAALNVYVTDGALAMDNNLAERAVKPYAIGRKNWLFFGSDDGGRRLAILSSFTATCQQFVVNPWIWLQQTLTRLPLTPADQLATLLPISEK